MPTFVRVRLISVTSVYFISTINRYQNCLRVNGCVRVTRSATIWLLLAMGADMFPSLSVTYQINKSIRIGVDGGGCGWVNKTKQRSLKQR